MKRIIAKRKTRRGCLYCNKTMVIGEVYYKQREVYIDEYINKINTIEYLICSKCNYKRNTHKKRYLKYTENCEHPLKFNDISYRYIPGECVQEPDYLYCRLCGNNL